jgi:GT2 family glycosyltransferase
MTAATAPRVTISLATWNGGRWLPACLASVQAQTLADWELHIVDNGSSDGSAEWLAEHTQADERVSLTRLAANEGYAAAHDRGIRAARGDTVLLLNQDVELEPGFLEAVSGVFAAYPAVASVQGLILRLGTDGTLTDIVDSTGLELRRDRRVVSRDQLRLSAELERRRGPVWGVDGPAAAYRRSALLDARLPRSGGGWEVLDEDFFSYKEDADLAWRLRRLGWTARYEPAAVAWHARGGGDSGASRLAAIEANMANEPWVRVLSWRNQRLMQLKNDDLRAVLGDLLPIARRELGQLGYMLVADRYRLRAIPRFLRLAPMAMRKRRALARRSVGRSQGPT